MHLKKIICLKNGKTKTTWLASTNYIKRLKKTWIMYNLNRKWGGILYFQTLALFWQDLAKTVQDRNNDNYTYALKWFYLICVKCYNSNYICKKNYWRFSSNFSLGEQMCYFQYLGFKRSGDILLMADSQTSVKNIHMEAFTSRMAHQHKAMHVLDCTSSGCKYVHL